MLFFWPLSFSSLLDASIARVSGNNNGGPVSNRGSVTSSARGTQGNSSSNNSSSLDHTVSSAEDNLVSIELSKTSNGLGLGLIDGLVG